MSDEKINKIEINMAKLETSLKFTNQTVSRIEKKIDSFVDSTCKKFAKKYVEEDIKGLKDDINGIKNVREGRNYDWLKYILTTVASVAIALLLSSLIK